MGTPAQDLRVRAASPGSESQSSQGMTQPLTLASAFFPPQQYLGLLKMLTQQEVCPLCLTTACINCQCDQNATSGKLDRCHDLFIYHCVILHDICLGMCGFDWALLNSTFNHGPDTTIMIYQPRTMCLPYPATQAAPCQCPPACLHTTI
jgi:hypothetical protein